MKKCEDRTTTYLIFSALSLAVISVSLATSYAIFETWSASDCASSSLVSTMASLSVRLMICCDSWVFFCFSWTMLAFISAI